MSDTSLNCLGAPPFCCHDPTTVVTRSMTTLKRLNHSVHRVGDRSLVGGETVLLPVDVVRRRVQRPQWSPDLMRATSTGLACGNSREEALLHALFEVVGRDVLYRDGQSGGRRRTLIAPGTVVDPHGRKVIDRLAAAGMALEMALVDGPYGLPVCVAYLWSENHPVVFAGGGCHSDPSIALTRALTKAAQSRLTAIAGTRDDLPSDPGNFDTPPAHAAHPAGLAPWPQATDRFNAPDAGFANKPGPWRSGSHASPATSRWPSTCPVRTARSAPCRWSAPALAPASGGRCPDDVPHQHISAATRGRRAALRPVRRLPYRPRPHRSGSRLYAEAMGEDYPAEVAASSSCDWPLLGLMTVRLRMPPGRLLVDAGCGTGGIGLWLARALAVRLAGFDLPPVAVAQATVRRADFLGTDADRAAFRTADLEDTGLPDSSAHGIVCVDALGRARDRDAARLYRLWIAHAAELRRELGEVAAQNMLREAHQVLPTLPDRRAVLLTLGRTVNVPAGTGGADTMCGLGRRPGDGPASSERTPS